VGSVVREVVIADLATSDRIFPTEDVYQYDRYGMLQLAYSKSTPSSSYCLIKVVTVSTNADLESSVATLFDQKPEPVQPPMEARAFTLCE
jgi:hypothetical protein